MEINNQAENNLTIIKKTNNFSDYKKLLDSNVRNSFQIDD